MKITIWSLEYTDWDNDTIYGQFFFLTRRAAKRFARKYYAAFKEYKMVLGGVPLCLW